MSISEQVKELRDYANLAAISKNEENIILRAANTIEALSATLNNDEEKCRYEYAEVYHIGETVNKLHELCGEKIGWIHYGREIADSFQMINRLCDIIESLSAKLHAVNAECAAEDFDGWIPCNENMPDMGSAVLIQFKSDINGITGDDGRTFDISYIRSRDNSEWLCSTGKYPLKAIKAWKPIKSLTNSSPTAKNTASHTREQKS